MLDKTALTYNMNILQKISSPHTFCVSVNANSLINPELVLGQYEYSHPVFTPDWSLLKNRGQKSVVLIERIIAVLIGEMVFMKMV